MAVIAVAIGAFVVLGGSGDGNAETTAPGALPTPGGGGTTAIVHSFNPTVASSIEAAAAEVNDSGGLDGSDLTVRTVASTDEIGPDTKLIIGPAKASQLEETKAAVGPATLVILPDRTTGPTDGSHLELEAPTTGLVSVVSKLLPPEVTRLTLVTPRRRQADADLVEAMVSGLDARNTDVSLVNPQLGSTRGNIDALLATEPGAILFVGAEPTDDLYAAMLGAGLTPSNMSIFVVSDDPGSASFDQGQLSGLISISRPVDAVADQAFDAVSIYALAAHSAGSTDPADVVRAAVEVTANGTRCTTYAQCLTLMDGGADIDFDGRGGTYALDPSGRPTEATYLVRRIGETGLPDPALDQTVIVSVP